MPDPSVRPEESPLSTPRTVLGLLGAIGAGKSHVARRIAHLTGAEVVDADRLATLALEGAAADGRLAAVLGPGCVRGDGTPDRAAIARRVFADDEALDALEALLHPLVVERIEERVARHHAGDGPALLVLDVPLLLERGLERLCDALWFVDAPEPVRLARAAGRGLDAEEVARRERRQLAASTKRARADLVLPSDDALDEHISRGLLGLGFPPPA